MPGNVQVLNEESLISGNPSALGKLEQLVTLGVKKNESGGARRLGCGEQTAPFQVCISLILTMSTYPHCTPCMSRRLRFDLELTNLEVGSCFPTGLLCQAEAGPLESSCEHAACSLPSESFGGRAGLGVGSAPHDLLLWLLSCCSTTDVPSSQLSEFWFC